jgi:para-aminobenzoate synthetase/4-amino-4-deoxychorismate lyase
MQIIRELEPAPRGVYCGAIGWVGPGRRAQFGVGIRTVTIDRASGTASYHVGSGVTWDSAAGAEYEECRLKAEVLKFRRPKFDLLESLKWDGEFPFLDQHIARLRGSAAYFGFRFDETAIRASLDACARRCAGRAKVRLIVRRDGTAAAQALPLPAGTSLRVALAPDPVDASNVYLYHKTTHREVYDRARTLRPECDDVLLWNQRGELTEATTANVVLRLGNTWYTPPVEAGLLPGVMRAAMLREGSLCEARLTIADLDRADAIALINSVRGWMTAALVEPSFRPAATA